MNTILEQAAAACLQEALIQLPVFQARGNCKYAGNNTKSDDQGSVVDSYTRKMADFPLFQKYLEVKDGSTCIRGKCIGFMLTAPVGGGAALPYLVLQDSTGKSIHVNVDKNQRSIVEFVPTGKTIKSVSGGGSSTDPSMVTMDKPNY